MKATPNMTRNALMKKASKVSTEVVAGSLPAIGFVRIETVSAVCGIAKSTVWKWCADGRFPKPIKMGPKVSGWPVEKVRDWISDPAGWQSKNHEG